MTIAISGPIHSKSVEPTAPAIQRAQEPALLGKQTPGHIPALDGLRGLAVLMVLFCHGTQRPFGDDVNAAFHGPLNYLVLTAARLCWTGVDLFFVLSGFLITGILFDAKGKNHFFRNFYARRTVRIFPLYYACLVLYLVVWPHFGAALQQGVGHIATDSHAWYWLYLSNYSQSYFDNIGNNTNHMVHVSWSLSIEEQFYLCWPMVVYLCNRKTLLWICSGMFFGSMLLRLGLVLDHKIYWALGYTPCRVDGLAVGAAIALVARSPRGLKSLLAPAKWLLPGSVIGLGALIVAMKKLGFNQGLGQSPGYAVLGTALFATLFGSLLVFAASATKGTLVERFFTANVLRIFGKYSYAVYLFHLPVMILIAEHTKLNPRTFQPGHQLILGLLCFYAVTWTVSLGVALISWNVLEKHFLKLKDLFPMENRPPRGAETRV